jgi:undecaprenyl pyrophosphate synthase
MEKDIISKIQAADQAKKKALRGLHTALGYSTAQALAEAILDAASDTAPVERKSSAVSKAPVEGESKTQKQSAADRAKAISAGKRPRLTEETKQAIAAALQAGQAGNALTTQFGVSYGVIHQIKSKLGLVTKKKASKKKR